MQTISTACGTLRERVRVRTLRKTENGFAWEDGHSTWAGVTPLDRNTIFSKAGIAAPGVQIILRRQALEIAQALLWRGKHIFLTDIRPQGRGHLQVTGAVVELTECAADTNLPNGGQAFPAVLTEKYLRHEQLEPYAMNVITYVLVTPKEVKLTRGALVRAGGTCYEVQLSHILDSTKNEYEIVRKEDL